MPRDGSKTRERILDSAEQLVLGRGFAATAVDDVIEAAKSSKGAFFHHFATKNELGRALVARYAAADIENLRVFMARAEEQADGPADQLVAFVRLFEEMADEIVAAQQSSCLYVSFLHDRQLTTDGTTQVIEEAVVAWRQAIRAKLELAATTRRLPDDLDLDDVADHVFVTFEGAFILARTMDQPGLMRQQLRVLRQLLERLLAQPL